MHYGKFSKKAQVIDSDDEYRIYLNSPQSLYLYAPGKLTFKSSNTKVAKVDSNGRVTPVKEGTCTITVNASATSIFKAAKKTIKIKVVK